MLLQRSSNKNPATPESTSANTWRVQVNHDKLAASYPISVSRFFALCSPDRLFRKHTAHLHDGATRVLLFRRLVEHLALAAQVGTLSHQIVQLLPSLEDLPWG
jgi:hypothetical protein